MCVWAAQDAVIVDAIAADVAFLHAILQMDMSALFTLESNSLQLCFALIERL